MAANAQEMSFARVGVEVRRGDDFSVRLTQEELAKSLKPIPTSPERWGSRQRPLPPDEIESRRRKLVALRRPAAVSRRDVCARLSHIASRAMSIQGRDIYSFNDLAKTGKERRQ